MTQVELNREVMLRELFPFMMANTPGGIHYSKEATASHNVLFWNKVIKTIADICTHHNVDILGTPLEGEAIPPTYEYLVTHLSVSGHLRKVRNKWKKIMRREGWDCGDHLWRREDGRDHEIWGNVWKVWRERVYKMNDQEYVKDV